VFEKATELASVFNNLFLLHFFAHIEISPSTLFGNDEALIRSTRNDIWQAGKKDEAGTAKNYLLYEVERAI
jgi:hypothetical protein